MTATPTVEDILSTIEERRHTLNLFRGNVAAFFEDHPQLRAGNPAPIHSVKSRAKSDESVRGKIKRKRDEGCEITPENVFQAITDLVGVRVLHLLQEHFGTIHAAISENVDEGEWVLQESPKAYTWDPDAEGYFDSLGLETELKESRYTSVHYLVRPRPDSIACCEIQVRTLWEEIWGEVDHAINYPSPCEVRSCVEQIKVLAKLVGTGTRLGDSIFTSFRTGLPA